MSWWCPEAQAAVRDDAVSGVTRTPRTAGFAVSAPGCSGPLSFPLGQLTNYLSVMLMLWGGAMGWAGLNAGTLMRHG